MRSFGYSSKVKKGFIIWEILLLIGVISFLFPIVWNFMKVSEDKKRTEITRKRIQALEEAIRVMYVSNLRFAEQNCYGWRDALCSGLTLTPYPTADPTVIVMQTNNARVYDTLRNVGCSVNNGQVSCVDGWGNPFTFEITNAHFPNQDYTAPYTGNFFSMNVSWSRGSAVITLNKEIEWSLSRTEYKLSEIATAIKRFTRNVRLAELTNVCNTVGTSANDPAGGLRSWDDAMVPWVWKVVSQNPNVLCSGVENSSGCGCTNHNQIQNWERGNAWRVVDTGNEWNRVLNNLNLPVQYRVDGFGNALDLVVLADANGNPLFVPPRPQPYYGNSGIWKTRVGVLDFGVWYVYFDIVSE